MKKTLAALIVGAFAASAANAAVIYDNEGTKFELNGSLRLMVENSNQGGADSERSHTGLKNDDSRFELKVKHTLDNGFYALSRIEVRFDGKSDGGSDDGFGSLRTHRAYGGFGHHDYGQVTFGRQVTIADDVSIANDYTYGILPKGRYAPTSGKSVIRYDYFGIDGLQLGASYQFAEDRDDDNEVTDGKLNNGIQFGFVYSGMDAAAKNGIIAHGLYGRTSYKTDDGKTSYKNGYRLSLGYDFDGFILSVDGGYFQAKRITNAKAAGELAYDGDSKGFFVSPGFQATIIPDVSNVYGNYLFDQQKQDKTLAGVSVDNKTKTNGFLLGVDYKLHKQVVTYAEVKYLQTKNYENGKYVDDSKTKDKAVGVGMRIFF